ncbi:MAG: helix-turn-helix transcriptional regulator [Cyclobacteriaceae bacterium]
MNKSIQNLKQTAKPSSWLKEAEQREKNEAWLDMSFAIAVKVKMALKEKGITQKALAAEMKCSPQYVNKLLRGAENLQLSTIAKLEQILDISLVTVSVTVDLPHGSTSGSKTKVYNYDSLMDADRMVSEDPTDYV